MAGSSRRLTGSVTTRRSGIRPGREDKERHVQLAAVEAEAVPGEPAS